MQTLPVNDRPKRPDDAGVFVENMKKVFKNEHPYQDADDEDNKKAVKLVNNMFSRIAAMNIDTSIMTELIGENPSWVDHNLQFLAIIWNTLKKHSGSETDFRPYKKLPSNIKEMVEALTSLKNIERSSKNKLTAQQVYDILTTSCNADDANSELCAVLRGELTLTENSRTKLVARVIKNTYRATDAEEKKYYQYMAVLYNQLFELKDSDKLSAHDVFARSYYKNGFELVKPDQALKNILEITKNKNEYMAATTPIHELDDYQKFVLRQMIKTYDNFITKGGYMSGKPINNLDGLLARCSNSNTSNILCRFKNHFDARRREDKAEDEINEKYNRAARFALVHFFDQFPYSEMHKETNPAERLKKARNYIELMDMQSSTPTDSDGAISTPFLDHLNKVEEEYKQKMFNQQNPQPDAQ